MKRRFLGNSGLEVSSLCFGAMMFVGDSGWRHLSALGPADAKGMVNIALDSGVNFFDTADIYSGGASESLLGDALGSRRKEAIIATKVGFRTGEGTHDVGLSRQHVLEACHASLRRLHTDYIDLYLLHTYDPMVPLEETLRALEDLVHEGKIRYLGCSNFMAWYLMKALAVADSRGWSRFVALQSLYALTNRDIETEIIPACIDQGVGIMVWGPLAGGFLTGKYRKNQPWPGGTRIASPSDHLPFDEDRAYRTLEVLDGIACEHRATIAQIALRWVLDQRGVSSVVFGARNREQLTENLRAAEMHLTAEELGALDAVSKPPRPYPLWHYDVFNKERVHD
ncbi:MAG: aldo/keto reductase [Bacteroidetes bacterium]|nr:aldo/keto reductase [Bacteroidota bacterium]